MLSKRLSYINDDIYNMAFIKWNSLKPWNCFM